MNFRKLKKLKLISAIFGLSIILGLTLNAGNLFDQFKGSTIFNRFFETIPGNAGRPERITEKYAFITHQNVNSNNCETKTETFSAIEGFKIGGKDSLNCINNLYTIQFEAALLDLNRVEVEILNDQNKIVAKRSYKKTNTLVPANDLSEISEISDEGYNAIYLTWDGATCYEDYDDGNTDPIKCPEGDYTYNINLIGIDAGLSNFIDPTYEEIITHNRINIIETTFAQVSEKTFTETGTLFLRDFKNQYDFKKNGSVTINFTEAESSDSIKNSLTDSIATTTSGLDPSMNYKKYSTPLSIKKSDIINFAIEPSYKNKLTGLPTKNTIQNVSSITISQGTTLVKVRDNLVQGLIPTRPNPLAPLSPVLPETAIKLQNICLEYPTLNCAPGQNLKLKIESYTDFDGDIFNDPEVEDTLREEQMKNVFRDIQSLFTFNWDAMFDQVIYELDITIAPSLIPEITVTAPNANQIFNNSNEIDLEIVTDIAASCKTSNQTFAFNDTTSSTMLSRNLTDLIHDFKTTPLEDGTYTYHFLCANTEDPTAISDPASVTFTVDTTPDIVVTHTPTVLTDSLPNSTNQVQFTVSSTFEGDYTCYASTGNTPSSTSPQNVLTTRNSDGTYSLTVTTTPNSSYTYSFQCQNSTLTTKKSEIITKTFSILSSTGTPPPTVAANPFLDIITPINATLFRTSNIVTITATTDISAVCTIQNQPFTTTAYNASIGPNFTPNEAKTGHTFTTLGLPDGTYTYYAQCHNATDNTKLSNLDQVTFTINTAPILTLTSNPTSTTNLPSDTNSVVYTATTDIPSQCIYRLSVGTSTPTPISSIDGITHNFTVTGLTPGASASVEVQCRNRAIPTSLSNIARSTISVQNVPRPSAPDTPPVFELPVVENSCEVYFIDMESTDRLCLEASYLREQEIFLGKETPQGRVADLPESLLRSEYFALVARARGLNSDRIDVRHILSFNDMTNRITSNPVNAWWMRSVTSLKGIVRGFREDNTLRPFDPTSIAEVAKVAFEKDVRGFRNDDFKEPWYQDTVDIARDYGLRIRPNDRATRADAVEILFFTSQIRENSDYRETRSRR